MPQLNPSPEAALTEDRSTPPLQDSEQKTEKRPGLRGWEFVNSGLFLWTLSTLVVGLGTWGYAQWDQQRTLAKKKDESRQNIIREIQNRVHAFRLNARQFGTNAAMRASLEAKHQDLLAQSKQLEEQILRIEEIDRLEVQEAREQENLEATLKERRSVYEELLQDAWQLTLDRGSYNRPQDEIRARTLRFARMLSDTVRHPDPLAESLLHFLSISDLKRELLNKAAFPASLGASIQSRAEEFAATALVRELRFGTQWMAVASAGGFGPFLEEQFSNFNGGLNYSEASEWVLNQLTPRAKLPQFGSGGSIDNYYQEALDKTLKGGGRTLQGITESEVPFMLLSALYVTLNRDLLPAISQLDTSLRNQNAQTHLWRESLLNDKSRVDSSLTSLADQLKPTPMTYGEMERQFEESPLQDNLFPELKALTLSGLVTQLNLLSQGKPKEEISRFTVLQHRVSEELKSHSPIVDTSGFEATILSRLAELEQAAFALTP